MCSSLNWIVSALILTKFYSESVVCFCYSCLLYVFFIVLKGLANNLHVLLVCTYIVEVCLEDPVLHNLFSAEPAY